MATSEGAHFSRGEVIPQDRRRALGGLRDGRVAVAALLDEDSTVAELVRDLLRVLEGRDRVGLYMQLSYLVIRARKWNAHLVTNDQDGVAEFLVPWPCVALGCTHRPGVASRAVEGAVSDMPLIKPLGDAPLRGK